MLAVDFTWPWMWFLLPLPWLLWKLKTQPKFSLNAVYFPNFSRFSRVAPAPDGQKSRLVRLLTGCAWVCFLCAIARPYIIAEPVLMPHTGRDMMLAVDLSESMAIEDMHIDGIQVDRLTLVKTLMAPFIQARQGDRIGLILFADTAYVQAPLTYDLKTLGDFLQQSQTGMIGVATAITDAIGLAAKQFAQTAQDRRVLILLTDGSNTSGNLTKGQARDVALHHGVTVYTIGIGQVDNDTGDSSVNLPVDQEYLRELAAQTGGRYFHGTDAVALQGIYRILDRLEPVTADYQSVTPLKPVFYWFLLASIGLFVLAYITASRWQR